MAGEGYLYSAGDKLPESTGDTLPESTGEIDSTFLGKLWTVLGKWLHWGIWIPPGNNLIFPSRNIKTIGDACLGTYVYSAGEY